MKKILIISKTNPNVSPRPYRMANWLKDHYKVEIVGTNVLNLDGIQSYAIDRFRPRWASIVQGGICAPTG